MIAIVYLCVAILRKVHPDSERLAASFRPARAFNGWVGPRLRDGIQHAVVRRLRRRGYARRGDHQPASRDSGCPHRCGTAVRGVLHLRLLLRGGRIRAGWDARARQFRGAARCTVAPLRVRAPVDRTGSCGGDHLFFWHHRRDRSRRPRAVRARPGGTVAPACGSASGPRHARAGHCRHRAADHRAIPAVGAVRRRRQLLQLHQHTGALSLLLIYIGVGGAEVIEARREGRHWWAATCALGPLLLLWVLYCNVYPVPDYPNNLWPYVTLAWVGERTADHPLATGAGRGAVAGVQPGASAPTG